MSIRLNTQESELSPQCICAGWAKAKYMNLVVSPFVRPRQIHSSFGPDSRCEEALKVLSAIDMPDDTIIRLLMTVNSLGVLADPKSFDFFSILKWNLLDLAGGLGKPLVVSINHWPGQGERYNDDLQYLATFRPDNKIYIGDRDNKRIRKRYLLQ